MRKVFVQWLWTVSAGAFVGALIYMLFDQNPNIVYGAEATFVSLLCLTAAALLGRKQVSREDALKKQAIGHLSAVAKILANFQEGFIIKPRRD